MTYGDREILQQHVDHLLGVIANKDAYIRSLEMRLAAETARAGEAEDLSPTAYSETQAPTEPS